MPDSTDRAPGTADDLAALLAEWNRITEAATPGPWWSDEDEDAWQLFGTAILGGPMCANPRPADLQLIKAPKQHSLFAEYWPSEADTEFIITARTAMPLLLAAHRAVLRLADHFASEADRFGKLSESADEESGAALAALAAWQAYDRCARSFREAITCELAGKEADSG